MYAAFILGLISLFIGIWINQKRKHFLKIGTRVAGTVINLQEQEINERTIYLPVLRIDSENREVTIQSGTNMRPEIGSIIEILYDPENPDDVIRYSARMSTPSLVFIIVGSVFMFVGLVIVAFKVVWDSL